MGREWVQELSESSWSSEVVSDLEDDDKVLAGLTKSRKAQRGGKVNYPALWKQKSILASVCWQIEGDNMTRCGGKEIILVW